MTSFKYGLILLRYYLTDSLFSIIFTLIFNVIVTPKAIYSYWFILTPAIMSVSLLYLFALFSFSNLKRFLEALIILSLISSFSF